jgi:peptide/nickel transport system permease protein
MGLFGLIVLAIVVAMALSADLIYPDGALNIAGSPLTWPGVDRAFPLGTDSLGRDIAAGLVHGARVSLAVGLIAAGAASLIGACIGAVAGYYGRWIDDALMRFTDAVQTIPSFLLAIVIVGILEPSLKTIISAIALVSWPMIARLVRAEFLKLRNQDFVLSCRIIGMSDARIIFGQIFPNCLAPIIVASSLLVASAIIVEAGLSFLGLGDPNAISWGAIIGGGRSALRAAWYITVIPAVAVVLTVLALNLLGDALNDVFNPRAVKR